MEKRNFRALLTARQIEAETLVCVGLDPLMEKLPAHIRSLTSSDQEAVLVWMMEIVDATASYACMFKPQHAHWEAIPGGTKALEALITYIRLRHPKIPIFMDCKRGDIDRTQERYGVTHLLNEGADGMNYNGYMGKDTLKALAKFGEIDGKALVGLGRTSNPNAWEIQDAQLTSGLLVWEAMAYNILNWSSEVGVLENAGIVMGAAHKDPANPEKIYSAHLSRGRKIYGNLLWNLIPGIGAQKGFVKETVTASYAGPGSIAINSSSAIIFASSGSDCGEAAALEAKKMRYEINGCLLDMGASYEL